MDFHHGSPLYPYGIPRKAVKYTIYVHTSVVRYEHDNSRVTSPRRFSARARALPSRPRFCCLGRTLYYEHGLGTHTRGTDRETATGRWSRRRQPNRTRNGRAKATDSRVASPPFPSVSQTADSAGRHMRTTPQTFGSHHASRRALLRPPTPRPASRLPYTARAASPARAPHSAPSWRLHQ